MFQIIILYFRTLPFFAKICNTLSVFSIKKEQLHAFRHASVLLETDIHQYPTLRAAFQPDIALFTIQEIQPLPDIAKTDALIIRRSFSDLPVNRCHFLRFQKGAGILHLNGKTLRFPDPEINVPHLRGAASVNETILHHRLNDKPRKILILDSVITL